MTGGGPYCENCTRHMDVCDCHVPRVVWHRVADVLPPVDRWILVAAPGQPAVMGMWRGPHYGWWLCSETGAVPTPWLPTFWAEIPRGPT